MPVTSQLPFTQDAVQYAAVTSTGLVCTGKGKVKASKKGAATDKLLPPLIFSIESWEAQLITLSTASETQRSSLAAMRPVFVGDPQVVSASMAASSPRPDPAWTVSPCRCKCCRALQAR